MDGWMDGWMKGWMDEIEGMVAALDCKKVVHPQHANSATTIFFYRFEITLCC